jgi:outer membrane protein OmpU
MIVMKKILLGTTGLFGAAVLFASAASAAETPKVTVGGFIDFQAGIMSDDLDASQRGYGFRNDTEVSISVDGKTDTGLGYGAVIDLEADVTADADGQGLNASRTYTYLDGNWGRFELGSNNSSIEALKVDASNIARGSGGIHGGWWYFANHTGAPYITSAALPQDHGSMLVAGGETGFQLGLSYAPDDTDRGQTVTRSDVGGFGDIFDIGLNYENQWDEISLAAAITGEFGDSDSSAVEDIAAWNIGAALGYMGFHIAASYGDWNDSMMASSSSADSNYWTLGGSYDFGAFGASITYLDSKVEVAGGDNDFDNLSIGADYELAPGLTPYAEVSFYEFDAPTGGVNNDGNVFLLGTLLSF